MPEAPKELWTVIYKDKDDGKIHKGYTCNKLNVDLIKRELEPRGWVIEGPLDHTSLSDSIWDQDRKGAAGGTSHGLHGAILSAVHSQRQAAGTFPFCNDVWNALKEPESEAVTLNTDGGSIFQDIFSTIVEVLNTMLQKMPNAINLTYQMSEAVQPLEEALKELQDTSDSIYDDFKIMKEDGDGFRRSEDNWFPIPRSQ